MSVMNTMSTEFQVQDLIRCLNPKSVSGRRTGNVSGLVYDSRQVVADSAFFALCGAGSDGHDFIDVAIKNGATVIVMEKQQLLPETVTGLIVADSRSALATAASEWFGNPSRAMKVIGVTGTNGKTTITYLLEAMLQASGLKTAVIGTVNYRFAGREIPASHTTPESYELQKTLSEFRAAGADALVIEVSSHALEQKRVHGIQFDVGVFSNLTPEHLDYHLTMADYYLSKKRLFADYIIPGSGVAVVNSDDHYGRRLEDECPACISCGVNADAVVRTTQFSLGRTGIDATVALQNGSLTFHSDLLGQFNINNLLCAIAAAEAAGVAKEAIAQGIAAVVNIPGRLERVENNRDALILVDYAHTGDALENVLSTLKNLQPTRIVTIFGCGGDRDKSKRPVMGEVAARYSNIAIVTSDNPRTEDADAILQDILPGVHEHFEQELNRDELLAGEKRGYIVVPDRRDAIRLAVESVRKGDLLLVAGKGHEDYQIIGREKIRFDDREEILNALQEAG
jgi:UDP-N-acetylmuramoyl-L-alanyl-D-glutamate--2,6-diaminopimelate ligase